MRKPSVYITGNSGKLAEVRLRLPDINSLDLDLPEVQEIDVEKVIAAKLRSAVELGYSGALVEDTSLVFEGMGGLPGPLIKWFIKSIGIEGLVEMAVNMGQGCRATAVTIYGFDAGEDGFQYARGEVKGRIVSPRGEGFGWDSIFEPDGSDRTFGQLSGEEKLMYSMRGKALDKLIKLLVS